MIVGVNRFQEEGDEVPARDPAHRPRPGARAGRTGCAPCVPAATPGPGPRPSSALEARARGRDNLVPAIIDAVLAWATVGEIAERLRQVFGEHRETLVL